MPLRNDTDYDLQQDEFCSHTLYTTADPKEDIYYWDNEPERVFASQEGAEQWHEANCEARRQYLERQARRRSY